MKSVSLTRLTTVIAGLAAAMAVHAEPVRNGNDLALSFSTAKPPERQAIQKARTGLIHTFRYLRVIDILRDEPSAGKATVLTVEPSSDMRVKLVLSGAVSLRLVDGIETNTSVAANGRVQSLGTVAANLIVVDPAVLKFKDRADHKVNNELLNEVDSTAH